MSDLEKELIEKGFDSEQEFHRMVSSVRLDNPDAMKAFQVWKEWDGLKEGLQYIIDNYE